MSHKFPLRSRTGQVVGIIGQTFPYEQDNIPSPDFFLHADNLDFAFAFNSNSLNIHRFVQFKEKYHLTKRQADCIHFLLQGKTIKEIATCLGLSMRTVETHWNQIKAKMNCNNRSHLFELFNEETINGI